jgi:isocitrate/isopropylmalate dehydrogenase
MLNVGVLPGDDIGLEVVKVMKAATAKAVDATALIDAAMDKVIAEAKHVTGDPGGTASTSRMGDAVTAAFSDILNTV